jgi:hypothetical protein
VVIHVVIGERSANLRAFALKNRFDCRYKVEHPLDCGW